MQHSKIKTKTLSSDVVLPFNLFLKVNEKFLLYVRTGDELTADRFSKLKTKKIKELFIPSEDESQYLKFLDVLLSSGSDEKKSTTARAQILNSYSERSTQDFMENSQSVSAFQNLEKAALSLVSGIGKKSDMLKEFYKEVFSTDADYITRHAVATASLAACFSERIKLNAITQSNMAIAAMLMDIGLTKLPETYREKIYNPELIKTIPKDIIKIYHLHAQASAELVSGKEYINKEILTFVLTHEERKSGNGFPSKTMNLTQEQQILGLCHAYALKTSCLKMNYQDAFKSIQIDEVGNFDLKLLTSFKEMLVDQGMKA